MSCAIRERCARSLIRCAWRACHSTTTWSPETFVDAERVAVLMHAFPQRGALP